MARARRSSPSAATGQTTPVALVDLAALRPHPENPRRISRARLDQLKATLAADPAMLQARPLIALPDGTVIAGNQRLRAALELGWQELPVVYADLDEQTARLWMLRDNNAFGDWDETPLAEMLASLGKGGVELALAGFEGQTVDELLKGLAVERPDADDVPPLPAEPRSKPGEVYELGPHRLMCGDSTDIPTVDALMAGDIAQLVMADPPYNVGYHGGSTGEKRGRDDAYHDEFDDYTGWLTSVLHNAHAHSDDKSALLLWHAPSQVRAVLAAIDATRWVDRSLIIWNKLSIKGGLGQTSKQYRSQFEPMRYCHKKGRTPRWCGPGNESDVWDVQGPFVSPLHPTMKPVGLYERCLRNHTRHDDVVLELFGGSGTTLIAADTLGRRARLVEIDPGYCDVIRDRYTAWSAEA